MPSSRTQALWLVIWIAGALWLQACHGDNRPAAAPSTTPTPAPDPALGPGDAILLARIETEIRRRREDEQRFRRELATALTSGDVRQLRPQSSTDLAVVAHELGADEAAYRHARARLDELHALIDLEEISASTERFEETHLQWLRKQRDATAPGPERAKLDSLVAEVEWGLERTRSERQRAAAARAELAALRNGVAQLGLDEDETRVLLDLLGAPTPPAP